MVFLNRVVCTTAWSGKGRLRPEVGAHKNQSGPCRAIDCARGTHVSSWLPVTLLLPEIAHTVDRTSVEYSRSREKRAPTMAVGACPAGPISGAAWNCPPISFP